ncbi:response regulator transcription factor [Litchfieldia salsa]|uniref:DNA-binding response regulator, OmpR family, contains REC and winged-helix (WHTH) domain n=1 Tax=Litchfieldia salsa TaxID=930152 RepID=A0A1H0W0L1_9BACI|nr:response regulator transcription factor [Litchfieldia salsa]SDP84307.1 DNA-binding response regulator, OmpR family, contains REC and winged-helix (wHTH) domain [Litchfieldia salsa]
MNILVCDDDKEIVDAIGIYLENEGYEIFKAFNGIEAIEMIRDHEIHLIIMDIMMPKMDGIRAIKKIREENNIPLIFLSAKTEDSDKILGLNFGADDYITKPFNPLELIARVKSQLRRYIALGSLETKSNIYRTGGLMIDDDSKTITVDGEDVHLTPVQYKILKLLTEYAGKVFSIEEIYEKVWNETAHSPENTVSVHIRKIREKIEINPKEPKYLKVVWGVGYKVEKI